LPGLPSLPGLGSIREEAKSKQSNNSNTRSDNKAKPELCTLNNLRNGLLGKLEILKSGKARLRLGEMSFFVDIGVQQSFQQVNYIFIIYNLRNTILL